jgi:hypothetical protein
MAVLVSAFCAIRGKEIIAARSSTENRVTQPIHFTVRMEPGMKEHFVHVIFQLQHHLLSQAMELHAHPSILGPGFREPNLLTVFRPSRASIPFEGMGRGLAVC